MGRTLWLLAVWALTACAPTSPPNILVVVVDTLRADRVGVYGNTRGLTPAIDSLARGGTVFRAAYAQSPWTSPSIASLFTSRYMSQHSVLGFHSPLQAHEETLAELLARNGYATAAFTANLLIRKPLGFGQGFQTFQNVSASARPGEVEVPFAKARGVEVNRLGLEWVDALPASIPAFLYLHYMEPHTPYDPPIELIEGLAEGWTPSRTKSQDFRDQAAGHKPIGDAVLRDLQDLYDAEVMSVDAAIDALLSELELRGFLDNAIVVFLSDHGEEFYEHGGRGHGGTLFDELIHVPLIIRTSDGRGPREVKTVVSLVDLAPTLLEMVGIEAPIGFEGQSLLPLLQATQLSFDGLKSFFGREGSGATTPGIAFSERNPAGEKGKDGSAGHHRAVVTGTHKVIVGHSPGETEFYDLQLDPDERSEGSVAEEERKRLLASLAELTADAARNPSEPLEHPIDEKVSAALRALGYLDSE